jgi:hypothetical protein
MCRRLRHKRARQEEPKPVEPRPVSLPVLDIRVLDDGFPLTGRRYAGYLAEVLRRQDAGIAQDTVTVWHRRPAAGANYAQGTPRVNTAGELEIYQVESLLGTVRSMDGKLHFFPA